MSAAGRFDALFARNAPVYQKLPGPRSIRLIELNYGDENESIDCDLHTVYSYESAPTYNALSYCWGSDPAFQAINCNGTELLVTTELYLALKSLRMNPDTGLIWIDAICINQHDLLERNQQVSSMREIYKAARRVLVWLGPEDECSFVAFDLIRQIILGCAADFLTTVPLTSWPQQLNKNPQRQAFGTFLRNWTSDKLPTAYSEAWQSLTQFYTRSWFERVWVIQEICRATDAIVFCGSQEMPWLMVGLAARWLVSERARHIRNALRDTLKDTTPPLGPHNASLLLQRAQMTDYASPFLRILDLSLQFKATEPRDRIFALLYHPVGHRNGDSGCSENANKVTTPHLDVEVDYRRSLNELNREVAVKSIRLDQSLEALNYAWRIRVPGSVGLSWVAEWHAELRDRRPPLFPYIFEAAACTTPHITPSDLPNEVILDGVLIDQVEELDPTIDLTDWTNSCGRLDDCWERQFSDRLEELCVLLTQDTHNNDEQGTARRLDKDGRKLCLRSFCAFLVDLIAQSKDQVHHIILGYKRQCDICMKPVAGQQAEIRRTVYMCLQCRQGNFDLCEPCFNAGNHCPYPDHAITPTPLPALRLGSNERVVDVLKHIAGQEISRFYRWRFQNSFNRRTLFVTRAGHYGLCPKRVRPGDIVVVLLGGKTPFILRKIDDGRHQLVSDCYLQGAMDGEFVRNKDLQSEEIVKFTLV